MGEFSAAGVQAGVQAGALAISRLLNKIWSPPK
jgi:hypothetical protein